MKSKVICVFLAFLLLLSLSASAREDQWTPLDYAEEANWAYAETDEEGKRCDLFFIATTASSGSDGKLTVDLTDPSRVTKFVGTINMERGIYDAEARVFAPFYRQAAFSAVSEPGGFDNQYFTNAYEDVRAAFLYYLENWNNGRPILLAGFSQGGIMAIRLLEEFFDDPSLQEKLIACYAPGWRLTAEDLEKYPHLRFAQGEADTGVIIAFTCEAEDVVESTLIPAGCKTLSINPLNWKTDGTPADASLNLGACFTDYSGTIAQEIPCLTGAYIDAERGALKVTDVTAEQYPGGFFPDGIFHVYDYQFFYRNLQKNVQTRINAFFVN